MSSKNDKNNRTRIKRKGVIKRTTITIKTEKIKIRATIRVKVITRRIVIIEEQ